MANPIATVESIPLPDRMYLSDAEIVLGILAARLAPVLGLVACAIPVACLAGLLGGVEPSCTRDGVPGGRRRGGAGRLAGLTLSIATYATPQSTADLVWLTGCTVLLAGVAAALFAAAYLSFDRCLGRVSDWRDERAITSRERNTIRIPSWLSCGIRSLISRCQRTLRRLTHRLENTPVVADRARRGGCSQPVAR